MAFMLLWSICLFCFLNGTRLILSECAPRGMCASGIGAERRKLKAVTALLQELEETLAAGVAPESDRWAALRALPPPWGALSAESLDELRARGGALLPTLRRLRALAQEHSSSLAEAQARSAQAIAQALVCAAMVPLFGTALYWLAPGVAAHGWRWLGACGVAIAWAGAGALWMLSMAERARWAGLLPELRPWILAAQCAGERFLALVRCGNPADLAWVRAHGLLCGEAPGLAHLWGGSVWNTPDATALSGSAARAIEEAGSGIRKAVQVSLMEGRPCTERVESALAALRQDLRSLVEREMGLLSTRALKPLFICVAPALFLLLGFGVWLGWDHAGAILL